MRYERYCSYTRYVRYVRCVRDYVCRTRSVLAAAACGVDLREHSRFELRPGEFYDLAELVRDVDSGRFQAAEPQWYSEEEILRGRAALRELGPRIFAETEAGSWVLGPGVKR